MLSKKYFSKSVVHEDRYLYLVGTSKRPRANSTKSCSTAPKPDAATVRQFSYAMTNRLAIPFSTTIVGLLNVGLSRSNYDELSKWVAWQLTTLQVGSTADQLTELEKRFCRTVDRFPSS